jgi:hypothetical protein
MNERHENEKPAEQPMKKKNAKRPDNGKNVRTARPPSKEA